MFSVDIEEGKPPLKLPFNTTEDPWMAAQTFLHKHNLSQLFLDQVANFILENTKGVTLGQTSAGGADPFTGEHLSIEFSLYAQNKKIIVMLVCYFSKSSWYLRWY